MEDTPERAHLRKLVEKLPLDRVQKELALGGVDHVPEGRVSDIADSLQERFDGLERIAKSLMRFSGRKR